MVSQIKQKGFTIVELLIVIVVIAILAALSYVGYTSITNRAKDSTAQASAKAVKDAATTFYSNHGVWPTTRAELVNGVPASNPSGTPAVAKLPSDVLFTSAALSATTPEKTVRVVRCTDGLRIEHFKYSTAGTTPETMDAGNPTGCGSTYMS